MNLRNDKKIENELTGLEVAIIGYAGRFNTCKNAEAYWESLSKGEETFTIFEDDELKALGIAEELFQKENYIKSNGVLGNKDCFDAGFFGYTPAEVNVMDPQTRIFHEIVWEGLEMAGYTPSKTKGKIGLYASASNNSIWQSMVMLDGSNKVNAFASGYLADKDFMCSLISYNLNLKGPAMYTHTACSSSLVAVHQAARALQTGDCQIAVAGGVSASLLDAGGYEYHENLILSPDGHCRAFDAEAKGTVNGEGGGVVILKRYKDAVRDNDKIYGIIKGSAINNDGNDKIGYSAPSVSGQRKVIQNAIKIARVDPNSISYIEAHGTGTKLGDPIEIDGLKEAYKQDDSIKTAIGSVKTNIGHLDTAAGVASLIKVLLMMENKKIPASLHFKKPNPNIDFDKSSFYVNNELKPWESNSNKLRAGISSFGIGGTNCHIIVEEPYEEKSLDITTNYEYAINLSARNTNKLNALRSDLISFLQKNEHQNLADISYTLNCGRADMPVRKSFTARTVNDLISELQTPVNEVKNPTAYNKCAFVFSGQGSQYLNMGRQLYTKHEIFRTYLDSCFKLIEEYHDIDLKVELFKSEEANDIKINETLYTQLGLFSISYSLARFLIDLGVQPSALIGHSIGEYAGAVIAEVINLNDAIQIIGKRAKLMQQAKRGAMYAAFANEETIKELCPESISIAAVNSDELTVISGDTNEIEQFVSVLKSENIYTKKLKTSHAFHSSMMDGVLDEYSEFLNDFTFGTPRIPLISNHNGAFFEEPIDGKYWSKHLRNTVHFAKGIRTLIDQGYTSFIEIGPGDQLTKLIDRIAKKQENVVTVDLLNAADEKNQNDAYFIKKVSEIWKLGTTIDWQELYKSENAKRVYLPTYPFEKTRFPLKFNLEKLLNGLSNPSNGVSQNVDLEMSNWLFTHRWVKSSILNVDISDVDKEQKLLVFSDNRGLGSRIIKEFNAAGYDQIIEVVEGDVFEQISPIKYTFNYNDLESYKSLFEQLKSNGNNHFSGIIHCKGVDSIPETENQLQNALNRGYLSLAFLAKELLSNGFSNDMDFTVITGETTKITSEDKVSPFKTMNLGALKIISTEYDNLNCKMIDLDVAEMESPEFDVLQIINNEIAQKEKEDIIVSYRQKERFIYSIKKLENKEEENIRIRENGCYLIPGGFGGMGFSIAKDIAENEKANLALITRRKFPNEDEWNDWLKVHGEEDTTSKKILEIRKMQDTGAKVMILSADVSNSQQMAEVVQEVKNELGKINGVIWAAGVIDYDGVIQNRDTQKFIANIKSKVHGLLALEEILDFEELDFVALFSSIGNLFYKGKFGQVAYNVANEFFDGYSQGYSGKGNVFTINWCDWKEVGMTVKAISDTHEKTDAEIDVLIEEGLTPKEGVEVFRKSLANSSSNIMISKSDLIKDFNSHKLGEEDSYAGIGEEMDQIVYERPDLTTSYVEPTTELEKTLTNLCCSLFGINKVGIDDDFLELGGDSLAAIQFINQIKQNLNVKISLEEFFTHPTMRSFAEVIALKQEETKAKPELVIKEEADKTTYPLLPSQKRMFILNRLYPEETNYNQVFIFKAETFDTDQLQKAFEQLIQRHQVLRASYQIVEDEPVQKIHQDVTFTLEQFSIENDQEFDEVAKGFQRPFDLSTAPLLRAAKVSNSTGKDYLLIDIHHIISDGRSNQILLNDLMRIIENKTLEMLDKDFTSYVEYFHSEEVQQELKEEEQYWKNRFEDYTSSTGLITDFPRHLDNDKKGDFYSFTIDAALSKQIIALAKKEGATLFTYNLAIFYMLMSKLTDEEDVVVGTTHLGRNLANYDDVMGMFIETMALRNSVDSKLEFREFLSKVKENVYRDFDNRKYPFENLVDQLDVPKNRNRNPLFDVVFSSDDIGDRSASKPEENTLQLERVEQKNNKVSFDILFTFSQREEGLTFSFEYNADLFKKETIVLYGEFFKNLLQVVVNKPETPIGNINLTTADGKQSDKKANDPISKNWKDSDHIFNIIQEASKLRKNAVAIEDSGKTMTYEELMKNVDKLSYYLKEECNIHTGDVIALYNSRSSDLIISILAAMKARAVFVPIDISFPEERVNYILNNSGAKMILTNTEQMFNLPFFEGTVFALDVQMEALEEVDPEPFNGDINDLAYILFTSGSTGYPKGVKILQKGLSNYVQWANRYYFENQDTFDLPLFTSISFDFTLTSIFSPLSRGASISIYEDGISVDKSLKGIFLSNLRAIKATPAHIDLLGSLGLENTNIEKAILGGEALLPHHVSILKKLNPEMVIFNEYGPTEATVACSASRITQENEPITIGKEIDNTKIYILDDNMNVLPNQVPGEVYISGDSLAQGYLKEDITEEKFLTLPENESIRVYKTGDKGFYNSSNELIFLGRIHNNEQVKIRGYRIELKEIENVLCLLEEVERAVVSVKRLNDEDVLVAYYIAQNEMDEQKIRTFLMKYLTQQMIPAFILHLDSLPLTTNGKVDYGALPVPEISKQETYLPPVNETEIKLVEIWEEILGVEKNIIGINDSFFGLGGNSLKVVQLSQKIENEFGVSIPVAELFDYDTISAVIKNFFSTDTKDTTSTETENLHDLSIDLMRKINN